MPKKKRTKTQVKRKLNALNNAVYDLLVDKMGHADSQVPMSMPKLIDLNKILVSAMKRFK